jgi:predicted transcriptional regulator
LVRTSINKSRNRIAGRKIAQADFEQAMFEAILARIKAGETSPSTIGKALGKDRSTIVRYLQKMDAQGMVKRTETGRIEQTAQQAQQAMYAKLSKDEFAQNPAVAKWIDAMQKRQVKLEGITQSVSTLRSICDTLKVPPEALTVSPETNESFLLALQEELRKTKPTLRENGFGVYVKALRNFAMAHHVNWERNAAPSIASGRKHNYGDYSGLYANDAQRESIMEFAFGNFPKETALAIALGHEVLTPRDETLRTIKVSQIKFHQRLGFTVAEFDVYESKTESTWPKQAFDPRIVQLLREQVATKSPSSYLLGNGEPITQEELADALRQCYAHVGIDVVSDGDEKHINYWKQKPIHVMRHTTGHLWMRRSNNNPLPVAKMGWKTTDMVTQVYANMGLEEAWNLNRCDYCKPETKQEGDAFYCSWACALRSVNEPGKLAPFKGVSA